MKKIIIALFMFVSNIQIFSQTSLDHLKMKKLGMEEYLDYVYLKDGGKYDLKIFKTDKDGNTIEDLFFLDLNGSWSNIQISENRKQILLSGEVFTEKKEPSGFGYYKYYLFDGIKGKICHVFTTPELVITSRDFKYFLSIENYSEKKGYEIAVRKVKDGKVLKSFFWKAGKKAYGGLRFFRSENFDYDFRIIYSSEGNMYGECFYRVKDNSLHENYNDTFDDFEYTNAYSCSHYECGVVSTPGEKMKNENWD